MWRAVKTAGPVGSLRYELMWKDFSRWCKDRDIDPKEVANNE